MPSFNLSYSVSKIESCKVEKRFQPEEEIQNFDENNFNWIKEIVYYKNCNAVFPCGAVYYFVRLTIYKLKKKRPRLLYLVTIRRL